MTENELFTCLTCGKKLEWKEVEDGDGNCFECVPLKKLTEDEKKDYDRQTKR